MPTTSEVVIEFASVSKRYSYREGATLKEFLSGLVLRQKVMSSFDALHEVTFNVSKGESVGIMGRNGSGKSTLLKMIAGVTAPSKGRIGVAGRVSPLIELGAGFHPDLTGRENVFLNGSILGMTRGQIVERWQAIVDFAELHDFMETPIKHYSSGMYMRLGFSVAVHSDPDILIVDEALAVGDLAFQEKCLNRIQEFHANGVTIVLVSHSLPLIQRFCDRAIEIHQGQILMDGPVADVMAHYVSRMESEG